LAASNALLKFQSSILQYPIIRSKETETAAIGAAYIAAQNAGIDASDWESLKNYEVFEPSLSPQDAAAQYAAWRNFADWALKQPE
jgi:glycerol kinase